MGCRRGACRPPRSTCRLATVSRSGLTAPPNPSDDNAARIARAVASTVAGLEARQAAGFHTIAEAARFLALRHLDPPDEDESKHAPELSVNRLMAEPVFSRWRVYYESWLVGCIRDGSIRAIDRELWESRAPYHGDPAGAIFPALLLVPAEDVNRLEKARGSALAQLRASASRGATAASGSSGTRSSASTGIS
jgi:hypothetical protein